MGKKMLIDAAHPEETRVVVAQGNRIEEFDFESAAKRQLRGSIYLAKVTRVEPSLQAAFVDYGGNRHGFLAFSEIHPDYYQIPVADRQALLEEQAAEHRRLAEEDDDDTERGDRGGGNRNRRGRGRRGGYRRGGGRRRSGGRYGKKHNERDDKLTGAFDQPDLKSPLFDDEAQASVDVTPADRAAQGDEPSFGVTPLTPDSEDSAWTAAYAQDDSTDDGAGWSKTRDPFLGADDTNGDLDIVQNETGSSRPLLADPAPSITIDLPSGTDEDDTGGEADGEPDTAETADTQADGETDDIDQADWAWNEDRKSREPSDPEWDWGQTEARDGDDATDTDDAFDPYGDGEPLEARTGSPADDEDDDDADDDEDDPEIEDRTDAPDADDDESDEDDDSDDEDEAEEVDTVGSSEDALEEVQRPHRSRLKNYKIQEVIKRRQIMLVQVVKEERGNKGAALTTYLSLAGRYCVLMPNTARGGGISRKITQVTDRKRLKEIASGLDVPEGMGLIVRTAGANRTKTEIKRDFEYLLRLWENVRDLTLRSTAPTLVYEEGNLVKRVIRDLYSKDIDAILVEGENDYKEAKAFMRMLMPSHARNVQLYKDRIPLFQRYQVEAALDAMFSPQVELPSGGYLVIHQTEALVAIDVNSGRATREHSIEETALKTNMEAAEEVARQLRLRDLAGLIVIDFIDMEEYRNNRTVEKKLKECLKSDRARIQVGKISMFGLLEMSRQRLRAGVLEGSTLHCPHCEGSGKLRSVESASLRVLRACEEEGLRERCASAKLRVPSDVAIYMLNQKRRQLMDIEERYGLTVIIEAAETLYRSEFTLERGEPLTAERKSRIIDSAISMETAYDDDDEDMAAADLADDETDDADGAQADDAADGDEDTKPKRRRGRRRRGETREESPASAKAAEDRDDGEDENGSDQTEARADDGDDPDRPRRRRRRGKRGGRRNRRNTSDTAQEQTADTSDEPVAASQLADEFDTTPQDHEPAQAPQQANGHGPEDRETPVNGQGKDEPTFEPAPAVMDDETDDDADDRREPEPALADAGDEEKNKRRGWWQRRLFTL